MLKDLLSSVEHKRIYFEKCVSVLLFLTTLTSLCGQNSSNINYVCIYIYIYIYIYTHINTNTILPKVLAPLLMKGLTTLVISMSTNLNVSAYNDILGNLIV